MASVPSLDLVEATETEITVQFQPGSDSYTLQWKEYTQSWSAVKSKAVSGSGKTLKVVAEPLQPGTTYCVRLQSNGGEAGPELIIDTEQVGCTPKTKRGCTIL